MDSPIEPSVGRVVLYVESGDHITCALVTRVWNANCVNLMIMYDGGVPSARTSVSYNGDKVSGTWHWMDYQLKVAQS